MKIEAILHINVRGQETYFVKLTIPGSNDILISIGKANYERILQAIRIMT